jgi:hypothetical protein
MGIPLSGKWEIIAVAYTGVFHFDQHGTRKNIDKMSNIGHSAIRPFQISSYM